MTDLQTILFGALSQLQPDNDNQWTANGEPKLDILNILAGGAHRFTRDEVNELAPEFSRTNPVIPTENDTPEMPAAPAAFAAPTEGEGGETGEGGGTDPDPDPEPEPSELDLLKDQLASYAGTISTQFGYMVSLTTDAIELSKDEIEQGNMAVALRDALWVLRSQLDSRDTETIRLLEQYGSNKMENYRKNTLSSIDGYLEAQKNRPRVEPELKTKYTYAIDDPAQVNKK